MVNEKMLKNVINSLLILILLTANVEAKNSKDVSNIKVQKKPFLTNKNIPCN